MESVKKENAGAGISPFFVISTEPGEIFHGLLAEFFSVLLKTIPSAHQSTFYNRLTIVNNLSIFYHVRLFNT